MKTTLKKMGAALALLSALGSGLVWASDHDDGENNVKARALNLTDLYVFREGDQTGNDPDNANLIFIMNTNPRSVARQQYYFSTLGQYDFHVTRQSGPNEMVSGADDVILRFQFGAPDGANQQAITVTAIVGGVSSTTSATTGGGAILTTALGSPDPAPILNEISLAGATLTVFSGLREDPFFFDVEQYFRVRAGALGLGPAVGFRPPAEAVDFASGYNVNAIVVRVPQAFLEGSSSASTFDVWETISIPDVIGVPST